MNTSARQIEALQLLADGRKRKEAALVMGIAENTIKIHIGAAVASLGAASVNHAIAIGFRLGILK